MGYWRLVKCWQEWNGDGESALNETARSKMGKGVGVGAGIEWEVNAN